MLGRAKQGGCDDKFPVLKTRRMIVVLVLEDGLDLTILVGESHRERAITPLGVALALHWS